MPEEMNMSKLPRAVLIEFDFTALDGAALLYEVARARLEECGIELTPKLEALHLVNGNCQGAIAELFNAFGKRHDPAKAARELSDRFREVLTEQVASGVTEGFKAFVAALTARGLKVVIATRADTDVLRPALDGLDAQLVSVYSESSVTYGNCKWDAWRRAVRANELHEVLTVAVTGSGYGVKSALLAGLPVLAVVHDHTAWQDFGGADVVADAFSADLARDVFRMLHLGA